MQQDVLPTFLSAECSGLLLLHLLSDMWVKLLDHKRNGRNRPQQTLTDADYVFQLIILCNPKMATAVPDSDKTMSKGENFLL